MGRDTGPKGKISRRIGQNLHLKGARSFSDKAAINRKPYAPGQHGNKRRTRLSNYGKQLMEKQKVKKMYGLREKQFKNLYIEADRRSKVNNSDKGLELMRLLELRLDNVVYLLGLAPSRSAARQYVVHKHVLVNGEVLNIPSAEVSIDDRIELRKPELKPEEELFEAPGWLLKDKISGTVLSRPNREDIAPGIQDNLIIEFYSR